jgi:hypothetical protein
MGAELTISQTDANATAGALDPARLGASGIGWALGVGRLGSHRRAGARRLALVDRHGASAYLPEE